MRSNPKLRMTVIFSFLALICYVLYSFDDLPGWVRAFTLGSTYISLAVTGATGLNWAVHQASLRIRDFELSRQYVELEKLRIYHSIVNDLKELGPDQTEALNRHRVMGGIIPGEPEGPLWRLELPEGTVTFGFLCDFIEACNGLFFPAIRNYSGYQREQAEAITNFFVNFRWANPAAGNNPASFISPVTREIALIAVGYITKEDNNVTPSNC